MSQLHFEHVGDIAIARPAGTQPFQQAVLMVKQTLATASERAYAKLLIDITGLNGFESPSIGDRHWMVREWAGATHGALVVAVVCAPEFIDPNKFGIVAAANFGLTANVFEHEADAIAWLRSQA